MNTFFSKRSFLIFSMVVFVLLGIASCKYQEMTEYAISKFIREDVANYRVPSFRGINLGFLDKLLEYQEKSTADGPLPIHDPGYEKFLKWFQRKLFSKALKPFYQVNIESWLDQLEYAMMEKAYSQQERQQVFYVYALLAQKAADYLDFALGDNGARISALNKSLVKITDEMQYLQESNLENGYIISSKADAFLEIQKIEFQERKAKELGEEAQQDWLEYQNLDKNVSKVYRAKNSSTLRRMFKLEREFGRFELAWPDVFGDVPGLEEKVEAYEEQLWEEAGYFFHRNKYFNIPEEETQAIEVAVIRYREDLIKDHRESAAAKVGPAIASDCKAYQAHQSALAEARADWRAFRVECNPFFEKMKVIEEKWPEIFSWWESPEYEKAKAYEFQLKEEYAAEKAAMEAQKEALLAEADALHQKMCDLYIGHFEMEVHPGFANYGLVGNLQERWEGNKEWFKGSWREGEPGFFQEVWWRPVDFLYLAQWTERRRTEYGDSLLQEMREICWDVSKKLEERAGLFLVI